jgi:hypothetical protein
MAKEKNAWLPIVEKDDWGYKTHFLGDKPFEYSGQTIEVQFPDGTVETAAFQMRDHMEIIHEMGHKYEVTSKVPYITFTRNGLSIEVALARSGMKVRRHGRKT